MINFLINQAKLVWFVLSKWLFIFASIASILFLVRNSGKNAERLDRLNKILEVKDAQLRAANNAPRTRDELVERLRRGKF